MNKESEFQGERHLFLEQGQNQKLILPIFDILRLQGLSDNKP